MPFCENLFYRCFDGEPQGFTLPVILIHGAGGSLMGWPFTLRHLPGQRVIALDLPGHGRSDCAACCSMEALVRRLHKFIIEMGSHRVVLVGVSMGGALALSFANSFPRQVAGLAAISCGNRFKMPQEIMSVLRKPANMRKAMELLNEAGFHSSFPNEERRAILAPISKIAPEVLMVDFCISADFHFIPGPDRPDYPALVVGGAEDQLTPPSSVRQLARLLPKSTATIIPHAGHMLVHEKDETVKGLLCEFLAGVCKPV